MFDGWATTHCTDINKLIFAWGQTTHWCNAEHDLFRAAVVFTGAGVDSVLKQALRSCVPIQVDRSEAARTKYIDFVVSHIQDGDGLSARQLGKLLVTGTPGVTPLRLTGRAGCRGRSVFTPPCRESRVRRRTFIAPPLSAGSCRHGGDAAPRPGYARGGTRPPRGLRGRRRLPAVPPHE